MTATTSTLGIKTVLHPVSDLAAAKAMYTALLGVEPAADAPYYVGYDVEGQHIGLVPGGDMTSPVAYWHVPDIEAKLAEVDRGRRHAQGVPARRRRRPARGHRHRPGRQRPRAPPGPLNLKGPGPLGLASMTPSPAGEPVGIAREEREASPLQQRGELRLGPFARAEQVGPVSAESIDATTWRERTARYTGRRGGEMRTRSRSASPRAAGTTGAEFVVDGGMLKAL